MYTYEYEAVREESAFGYFHSRVGFLFGRWSGGGQPHSNAHWWGGQPRTWGSGNWGSNGGYASSDGWYGGPHHTPTAGAASSSGPGDSHTASGTQ